MSDQANKWREQETKRADAAILALEEIRDAGEIGEYAHDRAVMGLVQAHLAASPSPLASPEGDGAGREPLTEWRPHDGQHHVGDEKGLSAGMLRALGSSDDTDARRAQGGDDGK